MKKVINLAINDGDELKVSVVRHDELTLVNFWQIIDEGYWKNFPECPLETETMVEFKYLFDLLREQTRDILKPYCIEHWQVGADGFDDVIGWIMSQGRDYYYRALVHPETVELPTPLPEGTIIYSLNEALEVE